MKHVVVLFGAILLCSAGLISTAVGNPLESLNSPPTFATIGSLEVNEGNTLSFIVSAFDPDEDSLTLTAEDVPANATFVDHGDGTGTFIFTPDFAQAGAYAVIFQATDHPPDMGDPITTEMTVDIQVHNTNRAPQLDPVEDQSVRIASELSFTVTATDPDGTIPTLAARPLPPDASFTDSGDGSGQFTMSPEGAAPVDYIVWFVASDSLAADSQAVTIHVLEKLPEFGPDTLFVAKHGADTAGAGTRGAPYLTIQYAIDNSDEAYVIVVFPGEYNEAVAFDQWAVELRSAEGPNATIINGQGKGTPVTFPPVPLARRGSGGEELHSVLDGFTVTCPSCPGISFGGVTIGGGEPIIRNNKIINNKLDATSATLGGGIYVSLSSPVIYNNIIAGNTAFAGGGVYVDDGAHPIMVNNTIADNASGHLAAGAGIHITAMASMDFENGIIAFNKVGRGISSESMGTEVYYTIFYQNEGGDYTPDGLTIGDSVRVTNPGFVDQSSGDYHLVCNSASFNTGRLFTIDSLTGTDLEGNPRVAYAKPDLGALEFLDRNKQADFSASDTTGCDSLTVGFFNNSTCIDEQWFWAFGDGGTSTAKDPIYHYASPGLYDVTLVASGIADSDTLIRRGYILVYGELTANFTADTTGGCVPLSVTFTGEFNGIIQDYRWDFGDGATSQEPSPTHEYTTAGKHTVSLTVSSPCDTVTVVKEEMIRAQGDPVIGITSSHDADSLVTDPACSPLTVRFYTVSDDSLISYEWDFADNKKAYVRNPEHIYDSGGTYSVQLIATGPCGSSIVVRHDYTIVLDRPSVTPSADKTTGCVPLTVNFEATAVGTIDSYLWDFGDGGTASTPSASHTYSDVDTFDVLLIVTHECGTDAISFPEPIIGRDRPEVDFTCPTETQYVSDTINFIDQSTNLPTEWNWDFGDGGTSELAHPEYVYQTPGVYTVSLTAINNCGIGNQVQRAACVTVAGYELIIGGPSSIGDTMSYPLTVDTILADYPNLIYLESEMQPAPARGTLSVLFSDTVGLPPLTGKLLLVPSNDLSTESYVVSVSAVDSVFGHREIETVLYEHQGQTFLALQPDTLNFDSVEVNTTIHVPVSIINTSPTEWLTVLSVAAEGNGFLAPTVEDVAIGPASSIGFSVRFYPRKLITYLGSLRVITDDPAVRDTTITLVGRGIPEQAAPTVMASWPDSGANDILISDSIVIEFSEPVTVEEDEATLVVLSRRLGWPLEGRLEISQQSVTFIGDDYWPPLDTLEVTLDADRVYDLVYNYLDGNGNGVEEREGDVDDYHLTFITGPGVYPGDTDNDGEADERDVLPIGRFWLQTGPARPLSYEDFSIQPAYAWSDAMATYADADGDGIVDSLDVCPILEFWSDVASARPASQQVFLEEIAALDMAILRAIYNAIDYCPETSAAAGLKGILSGWIEQESNAPPIAFALYQNYPNPFNTSTVVTYTLATAAEVELVIFNTRGEKVTVLAEGHKSAGHQVAVWDGRAANGASVASGIYFYRLSAGDFRQTRKMILMK